MPYTAHLAPDSSYAVPPGMLANEILAGLPQDRLAQIAARRAFVDLKRLYIDAVRTLNTPIGQWLAQRLVRASDAAELWSLHPQVDAALAARGPTGPHQALRSALRLRLTALFSADAPRHADAAHPLPLPVEALHRTRSAWVR